MAGYDTESNNSEGVVTNSNDVSIEELENVTEVEDSALFIVQDSQNTKTINLTSLRRNLISDGDIPSDTKIYSSEKIQSMIKDHEDKLNAELAETNTTLDSVVQNYAKTETVNNQIQEIKDTPEDNPSNPSIRFIALVMPTIQPIVSIKLNTG